MHYILSSQYYTSFPTHRISRPENSMIWRNVSLSRINVLKKRKSFLWESDVDFDFNTNLHKSIVFGLLSDQYVATNIMGTDRHR